MDQNHLGTNLQLQDCLERRVANAPSFVLCERLDGPAFISRLDGDQLSRDVFQFGIVSRVDFGIGAVNVDCVIERWVVFWTLPGFSVSISQQSQIEISVSRTQELVLSTSIFL